MRFVLLRHDGETRVVGFGEESGTGAVSVDWLGGKPRQVWPSLAALRSRHCADGRVVVRWRNPFTGDWRYGDEAP